MLRIVGQVLIQVGQAVWVAAELLVLNSKVVARGELPEAAKVNKVEGADVVRLALCVHVTVGVVGIGLGGFNGLGAQGYMWKVWEAAQVGEVEGSDTCIAACMHLGPHPSSSSLAASSLILHRAALLETRPMSPHANFKTALTCTHMHNYEWKPCSLSCTCAFRKPPF